MHWFWRLLIAGVVGWVGLILASMAFTPLSQFLVATLWRVKNATPTDIRWGESVCLAVLWLGVFGAATAAFVCSTYFGRSPFVGQTRCRKCSYILRGISEPRCPECGERI